MHFEPTSAELEVRDLARAYARDHLAPAAAERDREGGFPHAAIAGLAARGLLSIAVPRALGGLEAGAVAYSLAVQELAAADAAVTVAACVSNMVAEVVTEFGTPAQRERWVPALCRGELVVGGFALSEPGAGSDPGAMRTRARRTDKGWVIDGSKLWITSGTDAGLFVVWARTSDAPGAKGISTFLVPGDAPGVVRGKPEHKLGLHGSTTTALDFQGVEVAETDLLHELDRGFRVAMMALDGGRIGIASQAVGIGAAALEAARRFAVERGLGGEQHVQWRLADAATELQAARLLALRAAALKRDGRPFAREASMAKLYASEQAWRACERALAVLGPEGLTGDFPVERHLRDVRVAMIYEGTSEVQRLVIARDIMQRFAAA